MSDLLKQHRYQHEYSTLPSFSVECVKEHGFESTLFSNLSPTRSCSDVSPEADLAARNSLVPGSRHPMRKQLSIKALTNTGSDPRDTGSELNNTDPDLDDIDSDSRPTEADSSDHHSDLDDKDLDPHDVDSDHAVERPTLPATFSEPSYSKGSFLPLTRGSFLQQFARRSPQPESNQSSYWLGSSTGGYLEGNSGTGCKSN